MVHADAGIARIIMFHMPFVVSGQGYCLPLDANFLQQVRLITLSGKQLAFTACELLLVVLRGGVGVLFFAF